MCYVQAMCIFVPCLSVAGMYIRLPQGTRSHARLFSFWPLKVQGSQLQSRFWTAYVILFGPETRGLPADISTACPPRKIRLPIQPGGGCRRTVPLPWFSLEAWRQLLRRQRLNLKFMLIWKPVRTHSEPPSALYGGSGYPAGIILMRLQLRTEHVWL